MTLRQTVQNAPAKTKELIAKLAATSNQAVKTRETLFQELTNELTLYVEVEEQHLLPLLRKHAGTKSLAPDAVKGNKELRARLAELAAAPKDDDAFLEKLAELKKGLQQHVRNERQELLPAVLKALDDEEASELASNMESVVAKADEAKREKKREEAAAAKREAERAEAAAEAKREAVRAEDEAKRERKRREAAAARREAALAEAAAEAKRAAVRAEKAANRQAREAAARVSDTLEQSAAATQQTSRQVAAGLIEQAQQAASGTQEAITAYAGTVQKASQDLRAVSASTNIAATGVSEFVSAWFDWAGKAANTNADVTRRLLEARSIGQLADAHQEFVTSSTKNLIERTSALLEITQRTSKQALRPLEGQLAK